MGQPEIRIRFDEDGTPEIKVKSPEGEKVPPVKVEVTKYEGYVLHRRYAPHRYERPSLFSRISDLVTGNVPY